MGGVLRLVHPFPSALNAIVVLAIAVLAGAALLRAGLLALAMLMLQFCIGAVNDLWDESLDRLSKPAKPLVAGLVTRRLAGAVAAIAGVGSLLIVTVVGAGDVLLVALAAWMLASGLAYDVALKRTGFGWLCFAVALPVLPIYAWYGATGGLPPRWEILLPVAALAGPALHIANSLIDLQSDAAAGVRTLAVRLGRRMSAATLTLLTVTIHGVAVATTDMETRLTLPALAAMAVCVFGVMCSAAAATRTRQAGWSLQVVAVGVQAVVWLIAASAVDS